MSPDACRSRNSSIHPSTAMFPSRPSDITEQGAGSDFSGRETAGAVPEHAAVNMENKKTAAVPAMAGTDPWQKENVFIYSL